MSTPAEVALPYGTIIGDSVRAPGGASDALPQLTVVNHQVASAVLELKSTDGALLITRLTTAQRNLLNPTQGMIIYNTTTNFYEVYASNNTWEALTQGQAGGWNPVYVIAGPVQMVSNSSYYLNSGATITLTLPAAPALGDTIEINTMQSNFIIAQNAGQQIRVLGAITTAGVAGSVTSNSGSGSAIIIEFNSQIWIAQSFNGTFIVA